MKRTRKKKNDTVNHTSVDETRAEAPRWRKKPKTGSHRMPDGTEVNSGDIIRAYAEDLRGAIDKFEPLDVYETEKPPVPKATLTPKHLGGDEWTVLDVNDKPIVDVPLTQAQAEGLINGELTTEDVTAPSEPESEEDEETATETKPDENEDNEETENKPTLEAKHKGGGRWTVIDIATGKSVVEGWLTKEDAQEYVENNG